MPPVCSKGILPLLDILFVSQGTEANGGLGVDASLVDPLHTRACHLPPCKDLKKEKNWLDWVKRLGGIDILFNHGFLERISEPGEPRDHSNCSHCFMVVVGKHFANFCLLWFSG